MGLARVRITDRVSITQFINLQNALYNLVTIHRMCLQQLYYFLFFLQVNCETDFVARNQHFRSMVSSVAMSVYNQKIPPIADLSNRCDHFMKDDIHTTRVRESENQSDTETIADMIAKSVGEFSENIVVSRGCTFSARDGLICSFAYNNVGLVDSIVALGSYGAFAHLLPIEEGTFNSQAGDGQVRFGTRLCQHIIGMSPLAVDPENGVPDSDALVNQGFIFDESATVGELLRRNGLKITNFVRYGIGESSS